MPVGELVGGRYRLDGRIADGGMGTVWKGVDTRLGRKVAVKLLHPSLSSDEGFRTRFASEATLVASLNTGAIATVHDYGEDEVDGATRAYLVMELVEGRSLADVLRRDGALDVHEAMRIIAEAAEGLHDAHRAGIVHRDVKPANILIADDGSVKLIDFGIARALGAAGLTETGMVIGTVTYTAPEQLADEDPAPAADVYSLGVVAYECLAGTAPFSSEKVPAIIHGHLNQVPPPLPEDVPQAVSDAVMTALRKDPDDRWRTAERFARACREALDGVTADERAAPLSSYAAVMEALIRERPEITVDAAETKELAEEKAARGQPRRLLVPILAALIIALLAVVAVGRPWSGPTVGDRAVRDYDLPPLSSLSPGAGESGQPQVDASDGGNSADDESDDAQTDEPGPGRTDPGGDGDPGGDDPGGDDPGDGEDPTSGKVPDLAGVPVTDADDRLRAKGFGNSKAEAKMDWQGETCVVVEQTPKAGSVVDFDTQITFVYVETYPQCLSSFVSLPNGGGDGTPALGPAVSRDRAAVRRRASVRRARR